MKFKIKEIRKKKRLSQEELSEISGVSRATISSLEARKDVITKIDTLQKLADALNVKVSDFLD